MTELTVWTARSLVLLVGVAAVLWLIAQTWVVVLPVLLALLLSTVLWPPVRYARRVMPAALAALAALVVGLGLIGGVLFALVQAAVDEGPDIVSQAADGVRTLQDTLDGLPVDIGSDQLDEAVSTAVSQLQDNAQTITTQVVAGLNSVGSAVVTLLLTLALTFFFLKDGPRFTPWVSSMLTPHGAGHVGVLGARIWKTLTGFIWSQAAVALVDAVFIGGALFILQVPLALPLAVLVFFGGFIPIVGALSTGAVAVLVALVDGGLTAGLIVLAVIVVVQQLEGNVLQPALVGKALRLHPAVVLLSVTAGGTLLGIVGAFLAVPVAAVISDVLRYVRERVELVPPPAAEG